MRSELAATAPHKPADNTATTIAAAVGYSSHSVTKRGLA